MKTRKFAGVTTWLLNAKVTREKHVALILGLSWLLFDFFSVFSVPLWLFLLRNSEPQRHREHRGDTEKHVALISA